MAASSSVGGKGSRRKRRKTRSLKARVRGLERLLSRKAESLPKDAVQEKRDELKALRRVAVDRKQRDRPARNRKRYKSVKFFERRKLIRRRQQLERDVKSGKASADAAMDEKEQIYRDLLYIKCFPDDRKYVALFPAGGQHSDRARQCIQEVRAEVERRLEEGDDMDVDNSDDDEDDSERQLASSSDDDGDDDRVQRGRHSSASKAESAAGAGAKKTPTARDGSSKRLEAPGLLKQNDDIVDEVSDSDTNDDTVEDDLFEVASSGDEARDVASPADKKGSAAKKGSHAKRGARGKKVRKRSAR